MMKNNVEEILSGQPPLEKIKDCLFKRDKTGFNLKASIFYGEKGNNPRVPIVYYPTRTQDWYGRWS